MKLFTSDDEEFLSPWIDATNSATKEVNGLYFNPGTRRDICTGYRLQNVGYDFDSHLFDGRKNITNLKPDWMSLRCGDTNCKTFEVW